MQLVDIPRQPLTQDEQVAIIDKAQGLVVRDLIKTSTENGHLRAERNAMRHVLEEIKGELTGWKRDRVNDVLKQVRR